MRKKINGPPVINGLDKLDKLARKGEEPFYSTQYTIPPCCYCEQPFEVGDAMGVVCVDQLAHLECFGK